MSGYIKGFPVPPGFVVSAKAYKTFFESLQLLQPEGEIYHLKNALPEDLEKYWFFDNSRESKLKFALQSSRVPEN